MSFISSMFSGTQNNFTPGMSGGDQTAESNARLNYYAANTGLNNLAGTLTNQMNGIGPNLANLNLQNFTGSNVANTASLMAGQRGAGSNVGLMSRQIAQQGANTQQQAAGQAASNVLAQQLAAQAQLGNVYGTQGSLANSNYGTTVNQIQGMNNIGSAQAGQNAKANQGLVGGIANAGMSLLELADGGPVPGQPSGPFSAWSKDSDFGFNFVSGKNPNPKPMDKLNAGIPAASQQVLGAQPQVIKDPTQQFAKGGSVLPFAPHDYRGGGKVQARNPQQKATIPGNSYKNDKIPAMVSEGEYVINREIMQSPHAPRLAAEAVARALAGGKH